jgi:hypothetical protein
LGDFLKKIAPKSFGAIFFRKNAPNAKKYRPIWSHCLQLTVLFWQAAIAKNQEEEESRQKYFSARAR